MKSASVIASLVSVIVLSMSVATYAAPAASASQDFGKISDKGQVCLACHSVDKKIVGPAFKDVREKYAKDPKAVETLSKKVKQGGSGVWGQVPMPANALTDKEATELVKWVLGKK